MGNPYAPPRPSDGAGPSSPERGGAAGTGPDPATGHGGQPAPPAPPGPPAGGPPRPPVEPPPVDPEAARAATRRVMHFGLLLLAVILLSSLPFPWQLVSLAVAVAALVVGFRALVTIWRARVRGALLPVVVIGVGLTVTMALQMVTMLATWDIEMAHQRCLDGAITVAAHDRCTAERSTAIQEWLENLTGRP